VEVHSGTIFTSLLETQTTGSLGYLGRTIWVDVPGIRGKIILTKLGVYADNSAATAGLDDGTVYRTSTGDLKVKYT
jgi:hypothetical protein